VYYKNINVITNSFNNQSFFFPNNFLMYSISLYVHVLSSFLSKLVLVGFGNSVSLHISAIHDYKPIFLDFISRYGLDYVNYLGCYFTSCFSSSILSVEKRGYGYFYTSDIRGFYAYFCSNLSKI